ncbi:MAG: baseplate protein J [Chloroflexi bacterium]|nr:MAG: baseplate protein J [Phototrophicales bacterium]RMF82207.1 MAG: baseplate protein J [Chloroflexota bacterium]
MPLRLPDLDKRTYEQLVEEARSRIPALYPEWTDHNPSDPGIIMIELFAWLSEMVMFRLNRIPDETYRVFLDLLNEPGTTLPDNLDDAIRQTVLELRAPYRAVTCADYEKLVLEVWHTTHDEATLKRLGTIGRVHCVPMRDLTVQSVGGDDEIAPGHVTVIIVPDSMGSRIPQPSDELLADVWQFLDERRLLTTRHHVVGPDYVALQVRISVVLKDDALFKNVRVRAESRVRNFYHPLRGGDTRQGWPFGRDVYLSELYRLMESVDGVDYVTSIELATQDTDRVQYYKDGTIIGVSLLPHELVMISRVVVMEGNPE